MFDWRMGGIKMASWRIYDGFADAALAAAMYENYLYADYTDVEMCIRDRTRPANAPAVRYFPLSPITVLRQKRL